jgi:hypothetical protein
MRGYSDSRKKPPGELGMAAMIFFNAAQLSPLDSGRTTPRTPKTVWLQPVGDADALPPQAPRLTASPRPTTEQQRITLNSAIVLSWPSDTPGSPCLLPLLIPVRPDPIPRSFALAVLAGMRKIAPRRRAVEPAAKPSPPAPLPAHRPEGRDQTVESIGPACNLFLRVSVFSSMTTSLAGEGAWIGA